MLNVTVLQEKKNWMKKITDVKKIYKKTGN